MKDLQEIKDLLQAQKETYKKKSSVLEQRIARDQKRLKKLEDEYYKQPGFSRLLAEELAKRTGLAYEILGPFGLSCETSIWLFNQEEYDILHPQNDLSFIQYSISWEYQAEGRMLIQFDNNKKSFVPFPNDFDEILKLCNHKRKGE